jgi:protocatechuate 3,4-dioxygenase beta subunit
MHEATERPAGVRRDGRDAHPPSFRGFARCPTGDVGKWHVVTLPPGPLPGPRRHAGQGPGETVFFDV